MIECVLTILFIFKGYSKFNKYVRKNVISEEKNANILNSKNKNIIINKAKKGKKIKKKKKKINIKKMHNEMKSNPPIKKAKRSIIKLKNNKINFHNIQTTNAIDSSKKENKDNSTFPINNNNNKIIKYKYNDYELNNFSYKDAIQLDKRTFSQYYLSLLKYKQLLIFTFYTNNDYNSKISKICLFLFLFSSYYAVNSF